MTWYQLYLTSSNNRSKVRRDKNVSYNSLVEEDVDVMKERQRVSSGEAESDVLRLEDISKVSINLEFKENKRERERECVCVCSNNFLK